MEGYEICGSQRLSQFSEENPLRTFRQERQLRLLVDGDIVAYRTAAAFEEPIEWYEDFWTLHSDAKEVNAEIDNYLGWLMEETEADGMIVALTDRENFRKNISSDYKANRKSQRKPLCLNAARDHLRETYDTRVIPALEADDVISMLADEDTIVVSPDKDLLQVPGYHFVDGDLVKREPDECTRWFYMQILMGDSSDNYKGCPGIGPVKAERLLTPFGGYRPDGSTSNDYWMWEKTVGAYEKAGLNEDDALENARLAYLLKANDYNMKTNTVNLWQPPTQ
ncbi:MAG: hypothetical protein CMQ40_05030 [Gammaproteobacteria bacterium]|nr:hypothetical protein [Gammaproteobacteria bacterium]